MDNKLIYIILLLVIGLVCFIAYKIAEKFKYPKVGAMCLISGGVKTGKSTFAVALCIRKYNSALFRWKVQRMIAKMLGKEIPEEPLLYSNIPLSVPYVPLTTDILNRKERFRYGSVIYVCEASLVADSQFYRDMAINDRLLLFNKLIGHETRGGILVYDTQTIADCHNSIKKCLSEYFYIHHLVKWIPFYLVAYIREDRYSYDGTSVSSYDKDVEDCLTRVIIPKKTWKYFDAYCYSSLTDDLPVADKIHYTKNLKIKDEKHIVSFKDWSRYIHSKKKEDSVKDEEKKS